jgi:PAS domain S-box-containing protein
MEPPLKVLYFEAPDGSVRAATRLATNDERFTVEVAANVDAATDLLDSGSVDCVVVAAGRADRQSLIEAVRGADSELPVLLHGDDGDGVAGVSVVPAGDGRTAVEALREAIVTSVTAYWTPDEVRIRDQVLDAAPTGVTLSDPAKPDNPLIYVNRQFEELTGYDATEAIGRNCRFLQGPGTDPEDVAEMRRAVDEEEPTTVEVLNYRADGTEFRSRVKLLPLRDESGAVTNYLGLQSDVTDRVRRGRRDRRMHEARSRLLELVADPDGDTVEAVLSVGLMALEVDGAYLARVDRAADRHEVVDTAGDPVAVGDICRLSETFCRITADRVAPFGVNDVSRGWADDPARREQGIEAYLGTPVRVDGTLYGTIAFVDADPRPGAFTEGEHSFVALLAAEVGRLLERGGTVTPD